uniref:Putative Erf family protein n=1 Tax=viral metagenome TaxID=1070528 RepID=A0A6M3ID72_9ZZZZ
MEEKEPYEVKVVDRRIPEPMPNLPEATQPNAVILMAMQKNYSPELVEKMMALQERHEANEARKAYHKAMAAFAENPPDIEKDKKVSYATSKGTTAYSHAQLGTSAAKIQAALSPHGLHASWRTIQTDENIKVTCRITHELGHFEETTLTAGADDSGSKNSIQAIGSTISYLERYTLFALTGLASKDMDDDGNGAGDTGPSLFEQWEIKCDEAGEAATTPEQMNKWWTDNGAAIKKDLKKADAAKIYNRYVVHKRRLDAKTTEREPGSDDK